MKKEETASKIPQFRKIPIKNKNYVKQIYIDNAESETAEVFTPEK